MLGRNYIAIDEISFPTPVGDLEISISDVETEKTSEAGTDLVSTTRLGKRTFSFTLQLTSHLLPTVRSKAQATSCVMTFNGEDIPGRLRAKSYKMIENSNMTQNTDGLWIVGLTFIEV